jgi:pimeloyl-ACP methyl ester carboxylesterase
MLMRLMEVERSLDQLNTVLVKLCALFDFKVWPTAASGSHWRTIIVKNHTINFQSLCAVGLCGAFLTASCQTAGAPREAGITGLSARTDGSRITWSLMDADARRANKILLIAQGSGCAPAHTNANIRMLSDAAEGFAVLTIEKYGVEQTDAPENPVESCSEAYFANHTVSQRVADARTVLAELGTRGLWDGTLVLFGGSEGGAVVSILSHEEPETDAVVVFSTGTGLTMAEFFPMVVPPPVAGQMNGVFAQARSNPESAEVAGGNSFKWWADILDRRLSDDLLKSSVPVLLVHGENDMSAPVEAARATLAAFVAANEEARLTYWELSDRDHHMLAPDGQSHMQDVLDRVADWIGAVS